MFNHATCGQSLPTYLSEDHDPLYRFHQWQANLRILDIRKIKTVPYVPCSHPVVERLIGTVRRECLDRMVFWTAADLERKLVDFQQHYNEHRTMRGRAGRPVHQLYAHPSQQLCVDGDNDSGTCRQPSSKRCTKLKPQWLDSTHRVSENPNTMHTVAARR
jgi:Integrase core domain